jgi:hypothetical protein
MTMLDTPTIAPCIKCGKTLEWWPLDGPPFVCSPCNNATAEAFIAASRVSVDLLFEVLNSHERTT